MLPIAACYTISELAAASGASRRVVLRFLRGNGVTMLTNGPTGRSLRVPLSELQAKLPEWWDSICLAEGARDSLS